MSTNAEKVATGEGPELGDLVDMVGVELRIAQILADRVFASVQKPQMTSGHYTVLSLVNLNPGINQSALARCMYLDRSSMVPILDQFETKEWIERRRQTHDRRSHAVFLTETGQAALQHADQEVRTLENRIRKKLGNKNTQQFLTLIQQFQKALLALDDNK
jgi:DNA-binding MarR family transcriptional regulator